MSECECECFLFRETHGSGSNYHKELSKQLASFLNVPLKVSSIVWPLCGGDVYVFRASTVYAHTVYPCTCT